MDDLVTELFGKYKREKPKSPEREDLFDALNEISAVADLNDKDNFFNSPMTIISALQSINQNQVSDLIKVPGLIYAAEDYIAKCVDRVVEDAVLSLSYFKNNQGILHETQAALLKHIKGQNISCVVGRGYDSTHRGGILLDATKTHIMIRKEKLSPFTKSFYMSIQNPLCDIVVESMRSHKKFNDSLESMAQSICDGSAYPGLHIGDHAVSLEIYKSPHYLLNNYRMQKELDSAFEKMKQEEQE